MRSIDRIIIATINILRTRVKTILTVLSIAVGISAIYVILSLSVTGDKMVQEEITKLGIDGLSLYAQGKTEEERKIQVEYGEELKNKFQFIQETMPLVTLYGNYTLKSVEQSAFILGVSEKLPDVMGVTPVFGRLFSESDIANGRNVAIIDRTVAKEIYKRENIVGKEIYIGIGGKLTAFEIIGIIEPQKNLLDGFTGGRIPDILYIPYTTANTLNHTSHADQIAIRCTEETDTAQAAAIIETQLNKQTHSQQYAVENINGYIGQVKGITSLVTFVLSAIAGISLIVAGIGVMNIMLASVNERKKEIGIWIALGARQKDVFWMLLTEAIILCLIGGLIGGSFGFAVVKLLKWLTGISYGSDLLLLLIPLVFSFSIGIFSGIIPSCKAAKLCPVELLREE